MKPSACSKPTRVTGSMLRCSFSLRSLHVFLLLTSLPLFWLSRDAKCLLDQQFAAQLVRNRGGFLEERDRWLYGKYIVAIDLTGRDVHDEDLAIMSRCTNLESLSLQETSIGDNGMSYLRRLGALQKLYLGKTKITDKGLASISNLEALVVLYISETQVSNASIDTLAGFESLKSLDIAASRIDDDGADMLIQRLPATGITYIGQDYMHSQGIARP